MSFFEILILIIVAGAVLKSLLTSVSDEIEIDNEEEEEGGGKPKIRSFKFTDKRN